MPAGRPLFGRGRCRPARGHARRGCALANAGAERVLAYAEPVTQSGRVEPRSVIGTPVPRGIQGDRPTPGRSRVDQLESRVVVRAAPQRSCRRAADATDAGPGRMIPTAGPAAPRPRDPDDAQALRAALAEQSQLRAAAEKSLYAALRQIDRRQKEIRVVEELTGVGSFYWIVDADSMWWSEEAAALFRLGPDGPPPSREQYLQLIHAADRERVSGRPARGRRERRPSTTSSTGWCSAARCARSAASAGSRSTWTGPRSPAPSRTSPTRGRPPGPLRESRDRFAGVLDAATEQCIVASDARGRITVFNSGAERMLGWTAAGGARAHGPSSSTTRPRSRRAPPNSASRPVGAAIVGAAADGGAETRDWTYLTRDGDRLHAMVTTNAQFAPDGAVTGYISVATDITDRIRAQREIQESEARFRDTFEFAPNGMMLISSDPDGRRPLPQGQPGAVPAHRVLHRAAAHHAHPGPDPSRATRRRSSSGPSEVRHGQVTTRSRSSGTGCTRTATTCGCSSPSARCGPSDTYVIAQVEDITDRKQSEARLTHQALHDWLTGLPNRLLLMDRIEHALAASIRSGRLVGLLYIDLDGFKGGQRHRRARRRRPHPDPHRRPDPARRAARGHRRPARRRRVRRGLQRSRRPDGGAAHRRPGARDHPGAAQLPGPDLRPRGQHRGQHLAAGLAAGRRCCGRPTRRCTPARWPARGGSGSAVCTRARSAPTAPGPGHARSSPRELRIARWTAASWRSGGSRSTTWPTGRIVAVEQLLRWNHPTRGVLEPADFLDAADAADLLVPIGRRVLLEACALAREWVAELGAAAPPVHVNVAGRQLDSGRLLDRRAGRACGSTGCRPSCWCWSWPRPTCRCSPTGCATTSPRCASAGVRVALDDLGTGHASLGDVIAFPMDLLKIDVEQRARG